VDANPQLVEEMLALEREGQKDALREAIESGKIPAADRGLSYWDRIREMVDDVRSHAATRLDATFAGGVKVSVYRMGERQVRVDIHE